MVAKTEMRIYMDVPVYHNRHAGGAIVVVAMVLLALGGYAAVHWRTAVADEQVRNQLIARVSDLALTINLERVKALSFSAEDLQRPEFQRLRSQMIAYRATMGVRGIWSAVFKEGQLQFGPTSYAPGDPRAVSPGDVYETPPAGIQALLANGRAAVFGPATDALGDYYVAVAPVRDRRSDELRMIVGLEMEAGEWKTALVRARRGPVLSVAVLAVILLAGAGLLTWRNRQARNGSVRWRFLEAYLLAAFGLTLTLMAAWAFDDNQRRFRHLQFRQLAQANFNLVLDAFRDIEAHKLNTLERFFDSSQDVERDEFRRFTAELTRRRDIQAIAWVQPVPAAFRAEWEARARAEGLAGFQIWQQGADGTRQPAHGRPVYYPLWYLEPQEENVDSLGFDEGSEALRRKALENALATGLSTASEPVPLMIKADPGDGLVILRPVYSDDEAPRRLRGIALVAIHGADFLQMALAGGAGDKAPTVVALYQDYTAQNPRFIAASNAQAEPLSDTLPHIVIPNSGHANLCLSFPIFAFGQGYTLIVHPSPLFLSSMPRGAGWIALAVGVLLTVVLTAFTHLLLRRRDLLEAQVQARTAELRATLYSIGDAVVTSDIHGCVRQMNPVAVTLTGWPEGEARGKPLEEVLRISGDRNDQEPNLLARVLGGKGPEGLNGNDAWLMDRQGGRRPIDYSGAAIRDERGEFGGVVLVLRDISERKQAEAALHQQNDLLWRITDTSPVGIVVVDAQGHVTFANGTAETITGQRREEIVQRGHKDIPWRLLTIDGGQIAWDDLPFRKVLVTQGPIFDVHYALDRMDGKRVLLSVNGAPLRDSAGKISGAVFSLADITAQRQLQESFLQAQKMESVGRLAGGVAHDFNNMLSVINGYSEMLLARMTPDDPLRGEVKEILGAGRRSEMLVRQLLAFARKQTIAPVRMDLNKTVTATLKMLSRIIGEDVRLVWAPARDLWPVRMDPAQLDQILSNLVVNARDAITGGGGKVTIETGTAVFDQAYCDAHAGFLPGQYALLAVSDNGAGMDRQTLSHVFEPFFTTKPQGQGTGLGLATVYGIVRQNNGFINVYSEPGQGTTIKIYLPRLEEAPAAAAEAAKPVEMPNGTETILLVEDEEALLKLTELLLKRLGYTVLAAGTPGRAIHLIQQHTGDIHLLMTDVVMPEMSGRELWKRLSTLRPDLKCLYMSGYTADIITHHGVLDAGVHFLQKPFQLQALALKLREALEAGTSQSL